MPLSDVLRPRVPRERWPQATSRTVVADCGPTGKLVECEYPGQKFPWGLYEQSGHAGSMVIVAKTPDGCRIALTRQWRPVDTDCVELPAGNIGQGPEMLHRLLGELTEEVGAVKVVNITTTLGFSHDVGREIAEGGGPKCFFPFAIAVETTATPKTYVGEGDERTHTAWYTEAEVLELVKSGEIHDMVSLFFLLLATVIQPSDFAWTNIAEELTGS